MLYTSAAIPSDYFDNAYTTAGDVEHVRRKRTRDESLEDEFEDIGVTTRLLELQSILLTKADSIENQAE